MLEMPVLQTPRLAIRPFRKDDLEAIHTILDVELAEADTGSGGAQTLEERREWLSWSVANTSALARLYQPPYGDRAVVLRSSGRLIGAAGLVPALGPFGLLPSFKETGHPPDPRFTPQVGLYYAFSPSVQRQGFATEAARALIEYAFAELHLMHIVATTQYNNLASQGVMRKLGMRLERNPYPEPEWFQLVGVLENI